MYVKQVNVLGRKFLQMLIMLISAIFIAWGAVYVKKSGIFEPYPEAKYLTAEQEEKRPLYQQLSQKEKAVYTALYNGISNYNEKVKLPFEIDGEVYSKIYCMLEKQEGSFFYIDSTYYTAQKLRESKIAMRCDEEEYKLKLQEFEEKTSEIMRKVSECTNDFDKVHLIHDYLIENCKYITGEDSLYASTAYGCIVEKEANCEGYAKAFDYIADCAGINSILVTGVTNEGENHAWNQIKVDGVWYNADITWDDTDVYGDERHIYLLCNDADFSRTHYAENTYFEPFPCLSVESNYYIKNDLYISDMSSAERIIDRVTSESQDTVELKFADEEIYIEFIEQFINGEKIFDYLIKNGLPIINGSISVSLTENKKERIVILYVD